MLTARGSYGFKRVYKNGEPHAIMERSCFTGEWCYGVKFPDDWKGKYGETLFHPAFKPTNRQSVPAALKVIERETT